MPNWCFNRVTVSGDPAEMDKFISECFIRRSDDNSLEFSFAKVLPIPDAIKDIRFGGTRDETGKMRSHWWEVKNPDGTVTQVPLSDAEIEAFRAEYGEADTYNWCIRYWDTKWDVCSFNLTFKDEERIEMEFDTAWSPPGNVLRTLLNRYPELSFRWFYDEPGMGIYGYLEKELDNA
jgi:hypothetical protein